MARALNDDEEHPERIIKKLGEHMKKLDRRGIVSPVAVDARVYDRFEKNNNVNINVFGYEKETNRHLPIIYIKLGERPDC